MSAPRPNETTGPAPRLLNAGFLAICLSTLCYFSAYSVVLPVLPHDVTERLHSGNLSVGIVAGAFAVSAIFTRPSAGRLGNRVGRRFLMIAGSLIAAGSISCYGLAPDVPLLVLLRLVTGVGEGFFYTGSATLVSDLAPPERRGEAISYFSVAIWTASGLGPALGQVIYTNEGAPVAFFCAGAFSLFAALLARRVPRIPVPAIEEGSRPPLVHKKALGAGAVLALSTAGSTAFNAYIPLYVSKLHLGGPEFVFLLYAVIVLSVRTFFARLPDQWGPLRTGTAATTSMALGFVLVALVGDPVGLYLGTAVLAFGNSLIFPALMSMALNGSNARDRSSIVGTFTAFFDVASGLGGITLGAVAAATSYRGAFAGGGAYAFFALVLLQARVGRRLEPVGPEELGEAAI